METVTRTELLKLTNLLPCYVDKHIKPGYRARRLRPCNDPKRGRAPRYTLADVYDVLNVLVTPLDVAELRGDAITCTGCGKRCRKVARSTKCSDCRPGHGCPYCGATVDHAKVSQSETARHFAGKCRG